MRNRPHSDSLPEPLTPLIGRGHVLEELARALASSRLLTLTGAGGSGKTRVALAAARRDAERDERAVTWVDLTALDEPALLARLVAERVGVPEEGSRDATDALLDVLRRAPHLLVLDNCEHLVEPVAMLVDRLLRDAPLLAVLATSREPLGIAGERAWLVPPLSLPTADVTAEAIEHVSEAVALFAARVRDTAPAFRITEDTLAHVVEICRRLDGLPLALELAAARVRALGVAEIAARLDDAFSVLTSGRRGALPRHRTLRATIEWSVRLLTPAKQALLRRLGVFAGGFTLEAVEAVCVGDPVPADEALDLLTQLVERSLVVAQEDGVRMRYRLLETVRQFARAQLDESDEATALRAAHARWFGRLVAEAEPFLTTTARREHIARLDAELDNLRLALAWTRANDAPVHVELAADLCWYWYSSRHWTEGRRWLSDAVALSEASADPRTHARLRFAIGLLATLQGAIADAEPSLREAAIHAATAADARTAAYVDVLLGMALASQGRPEAVAHADAARAWFKAHDELYGLRLAYLILGTAAHSRGEVTEAIALCEEAVRIAQDFRLDREIGIAMHTLGIACQTAGDLARAERLMRDSLVAFRRDPSWLFMVRDLEMLGALDCARERWADGVRRFAAAETARRAMGARAFAIDAARYAPFLARARTALGDDGYASAWAGGEALTLDAAIDEALAAPIADERPAATHAAPPTEDAEHVSVPWRGLRVHVLGGFRVQVDGQLVTDDVWRSARPRELFLLLALHPAGRTRGQLGLVFWPEATAAQLKNNFHVTLHHVRRALGRSDAVIIDGDRYRLNPELAPWCDAVAFEAEVTDALRRVARGEEAREALHAALQHHRGRLAEGLIVGDWHLAVHDRLQRLATDAWAALGAAATAAGDWPEAIAAYEALVQLDDLHEAGHRALMTAYAASGARGRALRHYAGFVASLQRELDAEPDAETVALAERLRAGG